MNVAQALQLLEVREARILLAEASGFSQAALLSSPERALAPDVERRYVDFANRRKSGEPVAYIVGHKEFYGLDLAVNPAVLIPRPETELLVELALRRPFSSALDLGTGSGAVALALKKQRPRARIVAVEASAAALAVARRNAVKHGLDVEFRHGRWLGAVEGERFALIVANPPYVAAGDPHLPELRHEPLSALVSGADGLDDIKAIAAQAPEALEAGGWLLLEHGLGQDAAVRQLLVQAGLEDVATWPDLSGIPRVSGGRR
ncbi:MAG: peptide chain release factor N(5)-glutamine methyltransferase [Clostridia bacterium]